MNKNNEPKRIMSTILVVLACLLCVALVVCLILVGYDYVWTGFGGYITPTVPPNQTFQREKTLWDWLQILVIPLTLGLIAILFNWGQQRTERSIAKQRTENEQKIALDNQRENSLQSYLDRISNLLLNENLRGAHPTSEVSAVARAITLATLRNLDGKRKGMLLRFVIETGLIYKDSPIIPLHDADLSDAELVFANMSKIFLIGANLSRVKLNRSFIDSSDLSGNEFRDAILEEVDLRGTVFLSSNLVNANISRSNMQRTDINSCDLSGANLQGSDMSGAILVRANLTNANLRKTILRGAEMGEANLTRCVLEEADLKNVDLSHTNVHQASLIGAKYNQATIWPPNFDPSVVGARLEP